MAEGTQVDKEQVILEGFNLVRAPKTLDRGISMIVYANPGIGKTTLSTTLPPEDTVIINCEAGIGPLLGKDHWLIDFQASCKNNQKDVPENLGCLLGALRADKTIRNVVVDNISELLNLALIESTVKRSKLMPEKSEYGENSFRAHDWIHQFRDLTFYGKNVFILAWETAVEITRNDGVVVTQTVPMIGKRTAYTSAGIVDVCARLEVDQGTDTRWLRLRPSEQYLTKCQYHWVTDQRPADLTDLLVIINNNNGGK